MQQLFEEGTYKGTIQDWGYGVLPTGTEYFAVDVRLTHREDPDMGEVVELERPTKRELKFWLNSPENVDRAISNLKYLGYDREDFDGLDPAAPDGFNFRGIEVYCNCGLKPNQQGQIQENWNLSKRRKPPTEEQRTQLKGTAALFAERMAARKQRVQEAFNQF